MTTGEASVSNRGEFGAHGAFNRKSSTTAPVRMVQFGASHACFGAGPGGGVGGAGRGVCQMHLERERERDEAGAAGGA